MAVEQKQRDKDDMCQYWYVYLCQLKLDLNLQAPLTIMTLKSSKPRYVRLQKYLNLCFQRGVSKDLDCSKNTL